MIKLGNPRLEKNIGFCDNRDSTGKLCAANRVGNNLNIRLRDKAWNWGENTVVDLLKQQQLKLFGHRR